MSRGILIDPIDQIRAAIVADAGVLAVITAQPVSASARAYSERLPSDFVVSPLATAAQKPELLAPTILLVGGGGVAYERGLISQPRYELRAYAPTATQARELCYLALNAINERAIYEDGRVLCYVSFAGDMGGTMPILSVDPDTGTPYYYAFFGATVYAGQGG